MEQFKAIWSANAVGKVAIVLSAVAIVGGGYLAYKKYVK